jgi:hypothetical protein
LQEAIKAGTILINDGTVFPEALRLDSALYSTGWRSFTGLDGYAVDRKTRDAQAGDSIAASVQLEKQEAPQKEAAREKKETDDLEGERQNNIKMLRP